MSTIELPEVPESLDELTLSKLSEEEKEAKSALSALVQLPGVESQVASVVTYCLNVCHSKHQTQLGVTSEIRKEMAENVSDNLTERKRAASELLTEQDHYRAIFEHAAIGIAEVTPEGRWFRVNQTLCDLLGYTSQELVQLSFTDITYSEDVEKSIGVLDAMKDNGQDSYQVEKRYLRKDGQIIWVYVSVSAIRDKDDSLLYQVTAIQDISDLKQAEERLAEAYGSVVDVVNRVCESHDPHTVGHQRRVSELSMAIAKKMGMSATKFSELRDAALLHDIGKIGIPAEILAKPGRLAPVEFDLIKSHSQLGYELLKTSGMPESIPNIVHQHHERCDGTGYPLGLTADELLIQAKVLMVADVVEAMTSHRPYRPAWDIDVALEEIEEGAGTKYCPEIAEACLSLFREDGFKFAESST
ncbi:MAG: HD domain-containing phosphohydrolase [bacterium]